MTGRSWAWDPSLFAGAASFYSTGRAPYPPEIADSLAEVLDLDGAGRLLDVGCGPGSLTLLLAHLFTDVVGVDADPDMLVQAERQAERAGIMNITWRHLRAEQLPADIAAPTVITFAQSFHWMDRPAVAATARAMLADDGAVVHVHAQTHRGSTPTKRCRAPASAEGHRRADSPSSGRGAPRRTVRHRRRNAPDGRGRHLPRGRLSWA